MKRLFGALLLKKILLLYLAAALLVHEQPSYAFVPPATNFIVNRAVASAVTRVAAARGISATDPRLAATLAGMGQVSTSLNVASTAAGVGLAVAGAPVWLGIAAGLGVVAVGMGVKAWVNSSTGNVAQTEVKVAATASGNLLEVNVPAQPLPTYSAPSIPDATPAWARAVNAGAPIYRSPGNCYANEACYALPLPPDQPSYRYTADHLGKTMLVTTDIQKFGQWYTFLTKPVLDLPPGVTYTYEFAGTEIFPNSAGGNQLTVYVREARSGGSTELPDYSRILTFNNAATMHGVIGPQYYPDLDRAITSLPTQVQTAKISNDTMARLVDQAWQRAAMMPGYQGVPYTYAEPVTEVELAPWAQENPLSIPTIGDLMTPASNPGTSTVIISPTVTPSTNPNPDPNTNPSTSTNVNVVNTPNVNVVNEIRVDLGGDPGVSTPNLEQTPTAHSILSPLMQLMPSLKYYVVPQHSAEYPKPTFNVFERSIVMDAHCSVLDGVKPTLYAVMAAVWAIAAVMIVLTA